MQYLIVIDITVRGQRSVRACIHRATGRDILLVRYDLGESTMMTDIIELTRLNYYLN